MDEFICGYKETGGLFWGIENIEAALGGHKSLRRTAGGGKSQAVIRACDPFRMHHRARQ